MLRRNVRLRKQYLFKKSLEEKEIAVQEKKERLRKALQANKNIGGSLAKEAFKIRDDMEYEDDFTKDADKTNTMDDEYLKAGVDDPRILITTSRHPSSKLSQFVKELRMLFPNSQRINRGSYVIKDLLDSARSSGITDVVIVHETRGEPDCLIVSHLPYGPTCWFNLSNVVMRHDVDAPRTISEAYPHLIFNNFTSNLGERVSKILKYLYPVPKADTKRVMSYVNHDDFISFRHHSFALDKKEVVLQELGPRFELKPFKIVRGALDQVDEADVEWQAHLHMNSAGKKKYL